MTDLIQECGPRPPLKTPTAGRPGVKLPRLLIGLVVLICTEVFSGASVAIGLWHPWTWLVTYWLYFAHFFFFTTLAIRTGRTSLRSLYLWGVLFGLYESWITKVIWYGYGGDGKLALGSLGPFGFSELSMVFLFHPVMAFLLPLATACVLCPPLRTWFPELAWISSATRSARIVRVYLMLSCATTLGMNSGGPTHLLLNLAFVLTLLAALVRFARPGLATANGSALVAFGRRGFLGLCAYLALLYGVTYLKLRPEGLPPATVQWATLGFYAVVLAALALHARCAPTPEPPTVQPAELRRFLVLLAGVLSLSLILSVPPVKNLAYVVVVANFVVWTPLGFILTLCALWPGRRARSAAPESSPPAPA